MPDFDASAYWGVYLFAPIIVAAVVALNVRPLRDRSQWHYHVPFRRRVTDYGYAISAGETCMRRRDASGRWRYRHLTAEEAQDDYEWRSIK